MRRLPSALSVVLVGACTADAPPRDSVDSVDRVDRVEASAPQPASDAAHLAGARWGAPWRSLSDDDFEVTMAIMLSRAAFDYSLAELPSQLARILREGSHPEPDTWVVVQVGDSLFEHEVKDPAFGLWVVLAGCSTAQERGRVAMRHLEGRAGASPEWFTVGWVIESNAESKYEVSDDGKHLTLIGSREPLLHSTSYGCCLNRVCGEGGVCGAEACQCDLGFAGTPCRERSGHGESHVELVGRFVRGAADTCVTLTVDQAPRVAPEDMKPGRTLSVTDRQSVLVGPVRTALESSDGPCDYEAIEVQRWHGGTAQVGAGAADARKSWSRPRKHRPPSIKLD